MADLFLTLGTALKWAGLVLSPLLLLPFFVLVMPKPLGAWSERLIKIIDRTSQIALTAAKRLAVIMVLAQLAVILGRYVYGWSATWLNEIVIYSFAGMFLLAAAHALKADDHVRVDILRTQMTLRQRALVDFAGIYLFVLPICALILWSAVSPSFVRSWAQFEGSRESDGLPIYFLFRTLVPVFAGLVMAQGLAEALKVTLRLRGLRRLDEDEPVRSGVG